LQKELFLPIDQSFEILFINILELALINFRMVDTASKTGFISQIIGPVLDIEFPSGDLPKVYNALVITGEDSSVT